MTIRFTIEQRPLTDPSGRPVAHGREDVSFHACDAESADNAVRQFVGANSGDLIGTIVKYPGMQAVATIRVGGGVFTLHVMPSSQGIAPLSN